MKTKLFLIPSPINDAGDFLGYAAVIAPAISSVRVFFVEEEKIAQRLIKAMHPNLSRDGFQFLPLNEHTPQREIEQYLRIVCEQDSGIISEAGCPCVADPGSALVLLAHQKGITVVPLVGPSSILLALMASGLNGQNFAFVGYLPKERPGRIARIKMLENRSLAEQQTQIFMETPYRNEQLFADILNTCHPQTLLCLAVDLTGPEASVKTCSVAEWKKSHPQLHKKPAIFLLFRKK